MTWADHTGAGRRGIQRSGIKEEAEGRGTAAELNAAPSCVQQQSPVREKWQIQGFERLIYPLRIS
jgi:hypothetical protein